MTTYRPGMTAMALLAVAIRLPLDGSMVDGSTSAWRHFCLWGCLWFSGLVPARCRLTPASPDTDSGWDRPN